jgi:hypothetical protein
MQGVHLRVINADGSIVEEGAALPAGNSLTWRYTATRPNDALHGDKIEVTVSDLPGNLTTGEQTL